MEPELRRLLEEFGPQRQATHPEYSFQRLQNDGVWTLDAPAGLRPRRSNTEAPKSELLKHAVHAGFSQPVLEALAADPALAGEIARRVLDGHFPETLHGDILAEVGLDLDASAAGRARRDPRFRACVLTAYEHRCAVCDFEVRLGHATVGLEAAHIKWHQAGGLDAETNGLALCVLHHKTFDLGALTLRPDRTLLVSDQVRGYGGFEKTLLRFHGAPIRPPQRPEQVPEKAYLQWHEREVFKGRPRALAG